jgi:hypothetical protein
VLKDPVTTGSLFETENWKKTGLYQPRKTDLDQSFTVINSGKNLALK